MFGRDTSAQKKGFHTGIHDGAPNDQRTLRCNLFRTQVFFDQFLIFLFRLKKAKSTQTTANCVSGELREREGWADDLSGEFSEPSLFRKTHQVLCGLGNWRFTLDARWATKLQTLRSNWQPRCGCPVGSLCKSAKSVGCCTMLRDALSQENAQLYQHLKPPNSCNCCREKMGNFTPNLKQLQHALRAMTLASGPYRMPAGSLSQEKWFSQRWKTGEFPCVLFFFLLLFLRTRFLSKQIAFVCMKSVVLFLDVFFK